MSKDRVLSFSLIADGKLEIEVPDGHQIIVENSAPNKMLLSTAPAVVINGKMDRKAAFSVKAKIGQKAEDGSIYAGVSPSNNHPFFIPVTNTIERVRRTHAEAFMRRAVLHKHDDWQFSTPEELAHLYKNRQQGELHTVLAPRRKFHWCRTPTGTVRATNQLGTLMLNHSDEFYFIPVRYQL